MAKTENHSREPQHNPIPYYQTFPKSMLIRTLLELLGRLHRSKVIVMFPTALGI
jgi:hypothetical protein